MKMLKVSFFASLLVSLSLAASSGEEWISRMRKDHPRMFFNSDTWPQIKANAQGEAKPYLDSLLKKVESYPSNPKCSGMGPVVFREVKTATGSYKTTRATPINTVREWGAKRE